MPRLTDSKLSSEKMGGGRDILFGMGEHVVVRLGEKFGKI